MKSKRMIVLTLALAASVGLSGCSSAAGTEVCDEDPFGCVKVEAGEPIKMASLLVISGPNTDLGLDSQYGVEIAIDKWDGTIDGKPLEIGGHEVVLVSEDGGCSSEGGQTGANKLAADPQIVAVVGTSCSSSALGVADQIFSDKGITIVSPSNTGQALTMPATRKPFYFRTAPNDKIQGSVVADFAYEELGARTAATIHDGSPYAAGLTEVFADSFEALGGTVVRQDAIRTGDTDFSGVLSPLATEPPDFLYFPIFAAEGILITQQAKSIIPETKLAGSDGLWNDVFSQAVVSGVYVSGPDMATMAGDDEFYKNEFLPAYYEKAGRESILSAFNAYAYDAAGIILDALQEVAIVEGDVVYIPRTALRDAVAATTDFQGITGTLYCNANGDCQPSVKIGIFVVADGARPDTPIWSKVGTLE